MSDDLVLGHLRAIGANVAEMKLDAGYVKHRLPTLGIARANAAATEANVEDRLDRIERRLERSDTTH